MPTFTMIDRKGKPLGEPVEYIPIQVVIGGRKRELALHKAHSEWQISDPVSGGRILELRTTYRGLPCSSAGLTKGQAKTIATRQMQQLADSVGADVFNARLDDAAKQFAPQP